MIFERCNPERSLATRATALMVLGLLCFQLGRVYLVNQIDAFFICPRTQVWTSLSSNDQESAEADHEWEEALETSPFLNQDDSDYIQHCKGDLDGLGLIPLQTFGSPVAVSHQKPGTTRVNLTGKTRLALQNHVPPTLQPPRNLS